MHLTFGDIVIVEKNQIGVIVKSWVHNNEYIEHEVYVRNYNGILKYKEEDIQRYLVRHKYLTDKEIEYQLNAEHPFVSKEEVEDFMKKFNFDFDNLSIGGDNNEK